MTTQAIAALQSSAEQHRTQCGAGHITWRVWGTPSALHPPLLLLHGGSGSWTHWVRNIAALAASGRQVWVPDIPGFGDSPLPDQGQDADAMAAPLEQGLQLLLGPQPVDVVGFSFGGMVGGYLAADMPSRVARLVLVGAPGLGLAPRQPIKLKGWRHLADEAKREAIHRYNLATLMLHQPASIDADTVALHKANVLRDRIPGRRLSHTDVLRQSLLRVPCPVSAIYGHQDALYQGSFDALAALLHGLPCFRQLRLIDQAGHWVQYECADAFNAALLPLLD